jgi:hypothetical protein
MKKKLKILVILLILTFPSFSQTGTESDSLICLPSSILRGAIADIKKSDFLEKEVELLSNDTINLKSIITYKDSQLVVLDQQKDNLNLEINSYKGVDSLRLETINLLEKEVKKQKFLKNAAGVGGIILIILAILFV